MDPIDFLEHEQLLQFFRRHKTEMSLMENPHTFLAQLKDHDLITEEDYEALSSFHKKLEETEERQRKEYSEENTEGNLVKKKRKTRSACDEDEDDEEQPGTSSPSTPAQKKKSKILHFSSPLKKGEKGDIWTWDIFKVQLPVTCGDKEGFLNKEKLAQGEKCIAVGNKWYSPGEFETLGGKASSKNWKMSIRCEGTMLGKLIQVGHLKAAPYKRTAKAKKSLFKQINTVSEDENDDDFDEEEQDSSSDRQTSTDTTEEEDNAAGQTEQQSEHREDNHQTVFHVTCGDVAATLHKQRFASGTLGKCIRTEKKWMTPVDFVKETMHGMDASWRKDIICEGQPLSELIKDKILSCHSLLCNCRLCAPDTEELENQRNDDECWICKSEQDRVTMVECDYCPRSFHQMCHLPHVEDATVEDDGLWMCTFCDFENKEGFFTFKESREAALSCNISEHMLQCQYLLLRLYNKDKEHIFASNQSLYVSDDTNTPMWFGHIAEKLQENHYQTVGEFVSDIDLIFAKFASLNQDDPALYGISVTLKEFFDKEFNIVFKIEDTADS